MKQAQTMEVSTSLSVKQKKKGGGGAGARRSSRSKVKPICEKLTLTKGVFTAAGGRWTLTRHRGHVTPAHNHPKARLQKKKAFPIERLGVVHDEYVRMSNWTSARIIGRRRQGAAPPPPVRLLPHRFRVVERRVAEVLPRLKASGPSE